MHARNPSFSKNGEYIDGIHYRTVSPTRPNYIQNYEIRYFFNFFIPQCYNFIPFVFNLDPHVPSLEKFLHPNFDILASPVSYSRGRPPEYQTDLNLTYYAAEHLGVRSIALSTIFEDIHLRRNDTYDVRSLRLADRLGIDKSKVEKLVNSVGLRHREIQSNRIFVTTMSHAQAWFSYFLINGQYAVVPKGLQGRHGIEHMFKTIRFLVDK